MKNAFKTLVIVVGVISSVAIGIAQARAKFEVVSIRPYVDPGPRAGERNGGPGGGGPAGRGAPTPAACPFRGTVVDPGRITVPRGNAYLLLTWAYEPKACTLEMGLILGQPSWTVTDLYDFQATMPVGTPAYSFQQLQRGEAPKVQEMLQTMLEDRFKLKVHREKKEVAAYDLIVAKPGKMTPSKDQTPPPNPYGEGGALTGRLITPDGAPNPGTTLLGPDGFQGTSITVAQLAGGWSARAARPVIDKTGLKGYFDIKVQIAPNPNPNTGGPPTPPARGQGGTAAGAGLLPADAQILDALGLKLVDSKTTVDVIVIDHIEKPSEN
jgi:uncharacterized protein (TIGR03435 family)